MVLKAVLFPSPPGKLPAFRSGIKSSSQSHYHKDIPACKAPDRLRCIPQLSSQSLQRSWGKQQRSRGCQGISTSSLSKDLHKCKEARLAINPNSLATHTKLGRQSGGVHITTHTKEVSFVFVVFVSIFVNSYQRTSLQVIDPVNSQNNSFNWLCPRMKLDFFFYYYFLPRGPRQDYPLTLLSSAEEKLSYLYIIQAWALTFIKRMDVLLLSPFLLPFSNLEELLCPCTNFMPSIPLPNTKQHLWLPEQEVASQPITLSPEQGECFQAHKPLITWLLQHTIQPTFLSGMPIKKSKEIWHKTLAKKNSSDLGKSFSQLPVATS